jgi:hypothetical protein
MVGSTVDSVVSFISLPRFGWDERPRAFSHLLKDCLVWLITTAADDDDNNNNNNNNNKLQNARWPSKSVQVFRPACEVAVEDLISQW